MLTLSLQTLQKTPSPQVSSPPTDIGAPELEALQQILERTNVQLVHTLNAQGTFVTVLSVIVAALAALFTLGSIVAAVLLFLQSRESKEARKRLITDAEKQVAAATTKVQESAMLVRSAEESVQALLKSARAQLSSIEQALTATITVRHQEALKATGEAQSVLAQQQKDLEALRATVRSMFDDTGALVARDFRLGENSPETEQLIREHREKPADSETP